MEKSELKVVLDGDVLCQSGRLLAGWLDEDILPVKTKAFVCDFGCCHFDRAEGLDGVYEELRKFWSVASPYEFIVEAYPLDLHSCDITLAWYVRSVGLPPSIVGQLGRYALYGEAAVPLLLSSEIAQSR
jgi:hypothetical protein